MSARRSGWILFVLLVMVVAGLQQGQARAESGIDQFFPPHVFARKELKDVKCMNDKVGDWNTFNGKQAGRHDEYVDLVRVCAAYAKIQIATQLEATLACGPNAEGQVFCSPSDPAIAAGSEFLVVSAQTRSPFPSQYPSGQTGRISLFIDAGGDPKTKFQATAAEPNLSSQGTNVIYQLVFETVGTSLQPSIDLSAIDHRKSSEFMPTTARVWQHGSIFTFVVPLSEPGHTYGFRVGTFWSSGTAAGGTSLTNQDVAPDGHRLIPYRIN